MVRIGSLNLIYYGVQPKFVYSRGDRRKIYKHVIVKKLSQDAFIITFIFKHLQKVCAVRRRNIGDLFTQFMYALEQILPDDDIEKYCESNNSILNFNMVNLLTVNNYFNEIHSSVSYIEYKRPAVVLSKREYFLNILTQF